MKTRLVAFFTHLLLSIIFIAIPSAGFILYFYPGFIASAEQVWQAYKIILLCDIVLGPTLTFCIYVKGKKGLVFDLWVIALCQLAGLLYGLSTVYSERPLYYVFYYDTFYSYTRKDIQAANVLQQNLRSSAFSQPKFVALDTSPIQQPNLLAQRMVSDGKKITDLHKYWVPISDYLDKHPKLLENPQEVFILAGGNITKLAINFQTLKKAYGK